MRGPGYEIQIDESIFHGKKNSLRKIQTNDETHKDSVRDRLLAIISNNKTKRNYSQRVESLFVFGIVTKKRRISRRILRLVKLKRELKNRTFVNFICIIKEKESNFIKITVNYIIKYIHVQKKLQMHLFKRAWLKVRWTKNMNFECF